MGTNEICTDGILSLADMLRKNQTLQSLFIDHNFIDHIGCKAIAESLKTNNALKVLNMGSTKLLPSGIEALGKALLRNTSLQCLHLAHTGIGNAGASDIGEALKVTSYIPPLFTLFSKIALLRCWTLPIVALEKKE